MRDGGRELAQRRHAGDVRELRLRPLQRFLGPLALGDVGVGLERSRRPPLAVSLQGPAAGHDDLGPVPSRVNEFAVPTPRANQLSLDVFKRRGKTVWFRSCEFLPTASFLVRPYNSSAPRFQ